MIVPMKKASVIVFECEKESALKALRSLGLLHIEAASSVGTGEKLNKLREKITTLESCIYTLSGKSPKKIPQIKLSTDKALETAITSEALAEEINTLRGEIIAEQNELDRLSVWGELDPREFFSLADSGVDLALCEMPVSEFKKLKDGITVYILKENKNTVYFLRVFIGDCDKSADIPSAYKVSLPTNSTLEIQKSIFSKEARIAEITEELKSYSAYTESMKKALTELKKAEELESYAAGMISESLSENGNGNLAVSYLSGYIPEDELDKLKALAKDKRWGLLSAAPTEDDNVPTKLKNNKLVSLVYPLTDFIGTVPGYFEYDISSWFLGFILVFFGIIFGDGGYGLLICAAAGALMLGSYIKTNKIPPTFILILLLGGATVLWGTLTCTWFGLSPDNLPNWLKNISVPFISNVYADKLWYPFGTNSDGGLTTAQNVQILCFTLALIQLSAAHIKGMIKNCGSLKALGDLGSVLQLIGMYYVVLSLVVNSAVFPLGLVISGIPVGTISLILIGIGFIMSFIFANYEGSVISSLLESLKNIVSVLLGVVNVFSDIVSYIRLWAVGLAGAAISATVNELAGPLFGNFLFIVLAVILLVFGHGLNMILNILSVIVHGVRLNTLEFSSHLGMSWSGHKYKPFTE